MSEDVLIVGAGLAGLTAASELERQGATVQVLEARDRVGGRIYDYTTEEGHTFTLGAGWLGPDEAELHALLSEFSLETIPQYSAGQTLMRLRGNLFSFESQSSLVNFKDVNIFSEDISIEGQRVSDLITELSNSVPLDAPYQAPQAAEWDAITAADWFERATGNHTIKAFFDLATRNVLGVELGKLSFLYFLFYNRSLGSRLVDDRRIRGGSQLLCQRLAERLTGKVHLSSAVEAISQDDAGVAVRAAAGTFSGGYAIVAVPPAVSELIRYEPPLPAKYAAMSQGMLRTSLIKCIIVYESPFWRGMGLSGTLYSDEGPLLFASDNSPEDGAVGALVGFFVGDQAKKWGRDDRAVRREAVVQQLSGFWGPKAERPIHYMDIDWYAEPWTRTYINVMPPGLLTTAGSSRQEPAGRIYWAGTERSVNWNGCMEGAILSGKRAAQDVLARIAANTR